MKRVVYWCLAGIVAMTLAACGGGKVGDTAAATSSSSTAAANTVSGVVSAGSILTGTVYLKDSSNPVQELSKETNADGSFSFDVTGLAKPFLLKAVADANANNANGYVLFSFANDAGTANINPLSHLVVTDANGGADPAALYYSLSIITVRPNDLSPLQPLADKLAAANTEIQGKLSDLLRAYGIATVNPISDPYKADHTGLDGMLDDIIVDISNGADIATVKITNRKTNAVIFSKGVMTKITGDIPKPSPSSVAPAWSAVFSNMTASKVNSLVIDPNSSKTLYAGTDRRGVYKVTNDGNSWNRSALNSGLADTIVYSLVVAIDPLSQAFFAGTDTGVYQWKTTNGGVSGNWSADNTVAVINKPRWSNYSTVHSLTSTMVNSLVFDPNNPKTLYAATTNWGIYKFYSSVGSWSTVNNGAKDQPNDIPLLTNHTINSLVIDPANSQTIYAGTYNFGVFRSYSGGHAWRAVNNVSPPLTNYTVYSLMIAPTTPHQTIYAGTNYGVIKSINNGDTWNSCSVGSGLTVYSLVLDPNDPTHMTIYTGTNYGVFRSTNGGGFGSWSALNSGLPDGTVVRTLMFDTTGQTLYAGTYNGGVFSITLTQ